jgi:formylmethanofuran dehydrogenase subunit B
MCESKFLGYNGEHRLLKPLIRKNGEFVKVSLKEAIARAAEISRRSKLSNLVWLEFNKLRGHTRRS